jgi:hypothetical protein
MPAPQLNQEERSLGTAGEPKPAVDLNPDERDRLWVFIVAPPFFAVMGIALVLTSTSVEGPGGRVGLILGCLAFLGVWATAVSRPLLKELASRGAWVPPGTARHPVLVTLAIPVLIHSVLGTVSGVMIWVMRLSGLLS